MDTSKISTIVKFNLPSVVGILVVGLMVGPESGKFMPIIKLLTDARILDVEYMHFNINV